MTNKTFAPFELKMTEQQAFDGLKSTYGNELTAADVRACLLYTSPSPRDNR